VVASIVTACYDGKSRNFSFNKFTARLKDAFTDLENPGSEEHAEPKTEDEKKRVLFSAIHDDALHTPIVVLKSQPEQYNTFQKCIDFLQGSIIENKASNRSLSQVDTGGRGGRGRGRGGRGGRGGGRGQGGHGKGKGSKESVYDNDDPTRYYTSREWKTLTSSQKEHICKLKNDQAAGQKREISELKSKLAEYEDDDEPPSAGTQMTSKKKKNRGG